MTKLTPDRPTVRQTEVFEDCSPLIVELFPKWLEIRVKGKKARITMTYDEIRKLGRPVNWRKR